MNHRISKRLMGKPENSSHHFAGGNAGQPEAWTAIGGIMIEKSAKFMRLGEVQRRIPFSRSMIYLKISREEFPRPYAIGARARAWLESEIDEWIASRIANKGAEK